MTNIDNNTVHVVSFITIMISLLGVNYLVLTNAHLDGMMFQWLAIVDIVAFAGLSFYGIQVSANAQGMTVTTKPDGTIVKETS